MPTSHPREPKLVTVLREGIPRAQLLRDVASGLTVGIVALPLAIAFAIASGVEPQRGLATAIVAGFLISVLGGSRVQIGGPTGAYIVLVLAVVQEHGYPGLAIATLLAGALLVAMGLTGLGSVIRFVPYPVTVGFTGGIALVIASTQVKDLLGLDIAELPASFVGKLGAYGTHLAGLDPTTAAIGLGSLAIVALWPRVTHRVPGSLVALVLATGLASGLGLDVDTIGSRFGEMPAGLPRPAWPAGFELARVAELFPAALAIAVLGAIESLLSAVVADGMTGFRHRPNVELVAQGVANIASPLFGGIPATGAIARTATNVKNGGRTPVAGIVHALALLAILIFLAPLAKRIPIAALAGILLVVAYHMSEWRMFLRLFRSPKSDVLVLLSTFGLTVLVDLTVALQVGLALAALLFMKRMAETSDAGYVTAELREDPDPDDPDAIGGRDVPPGVEVFEIMGAFFFGAAAKFRDALETVETPPRVLVLRMRDVLNLDATGLHALEVLVEGSERSGTAIVLSGVRAQPREALERSGLLDRIGRDDVTDHIDAALARARALVAAD